MTAEAKVLVRRLGGLETGLWLGDQASTLNFCAVAEVRGPLEPDHLRAALRAAQARHPLLRVCLRVQNKHVAFMAWPGDRPPAIPLRIVEAPQTDWVGLAEHEIQTPLDWRAAPLVRCTWIDHGAERGTLLLCFNHMIGDGTAGAYLARDVLHACGDLAQGGRGRLSPLPVPPAIEDRLPEAFRGVRGLWRALGAARRTDRALSALGGRPARPRVEVRVPAAERRSRIVPLRFEPAATRRLSAACRTHETTVHGLLNAALCQALLPELDGPVVNLASPVNMRDRLSPPVGEDVCLYVSMVDTQHRLAEDMDLWKLAREVRHETKKAIARQAPFAFMPLISAIGGRRLFFPLTERGIARHTRFAERHVISRATGGVTNIGRLAIEPDQGPLFIEAVHFVVSTSILGHLILTAACLNDRLRVDLMYTEPMVSGARAREIAGRIEAALTAALG